jgi:hypothetical protein
MSSRIYFLGRARTKLCMLACAVFALVVASSAQASTHMSVRARPAPSATTQSYPAPSNIGSPTYSTIVGTPDVSGGCDFQFPKLILPNGATAGVAEQQISTDWSNCTTVVEKGTLLSSPPDVTAGGNSTSTTAGGNASSPDVLCCGGGGGGGTYTDHFRVTWYDPLDITLNWMQSNISGSISGNCVTSGSGGANDYWETVTGWKHDGPLSAYTDMWSCSGRGIQSYDSFDNPVFCWPDDIWTVYNGVEVEQTPYAESGWVYDTHEINGPACPGLHWGGSLS